ncbi:thiol methyltransferase [Seiridium cupressi]
MAEEPALTLSGHFHDHPVDSHPERWNSLWEDHKYTPWDRGGPSLALSDILGQRPELFGLPNRTARRALVPGCGRGHDVLLLASFGYDAFGLEVSPAALEEARKNAESAEQSGVLRQQQQQQQQRPGSYNWVSGNFFEDAWTQKAGAEKFDLIFDYTFFCALPPSARPRWARRMVDLLAPGGRLVCLEFPSAKPSSEPGPPWAAPQHAYVAYLGRPGHEPVTDLHGGVLEDKVEEPREGGLRRILHQEPQRTHPAGMSDGKMIDRISVWEHF